MTIEMECILAWRLLLRYMIAAMCYTYLGVLIWLIALAPEAMPSHTTALNATATGAMTGSFAV